MIGMVLFTVFKQFDTRSGTSANYLGYSDFLEEVRGKRIKTATIAEGQGGTENGQLLHAGFPFWCSPSEPCTEASDGPELKVEAMQTMGGRQCLL